MSISTIYNAIVTKANTVFASKNRLHNPYELTDNPELIMKDAWGLKVGSSSVYDMEFCNLTTEREFTFILIKNFATVGSKEDAFDAVTIAVLDAQQLFLSHLYSPTELGIESSVVEIKIENISGIEFMQTDQKKYLFCELAFRITTSEPVI